MTDAPESLNWAYWVVYLLTIVNAVALVGALGASNWSDAIVRLTLVGLTPVVLRRLNTRRQELADGSGEGTPSTRGACGGRSLNQTATRVGGGEQTALIPVDGCLTSRAQM